MVAQGSGGQAPPCQLGLLPTAAGVAMVTKQAFPSSLPASPSPSDQGFPGTKAPGCHGNGFQAPTGDFLIGGLSLQAKVILGVTCRGQSWVSSRSPGT